MGAEPAKATDLPAYADDGRAYCPRCRRPMVTAHNPRAGMGERVWLCESCVWLLSDRDLDAFYNKPELGWKASCVGAIVTIVVSLIFLLLLLFGLIGFAL